MPTLGSRSITTCSWRSARANTTSMIRQQASRAGKPTRSRSLHDDIVARSCHPGGPRHARPPSSYHWTPGGATTTSPGAKCALGCTGTARAAATSARLSVQPPSGVSRRARSMDRWRHDAWQQVYASHRTDTRRGCPSPLLDLHGHPLVLPRRRGKRLTSARLNLRRR